MEPNFVTVYRAADPSSAELIRGLLDDANIPYVRMADSATGVFGVPRHLEIVVPVERADEVLSLIREFVDENVESRRLQPDSGLVPSRWLLRVFLLLFLVTLAFLAVADLFEPGDDPEAVRESLHSSLG